METTKLTPKDAQAMLDRDALNKLERLTKRGGTLTETERRQLRRVVRRGNIAPSPRQVTRKHLATADPKTFEGNYNQRLRRRRVFALRMMNKTVDQMCEELGASTHTVVADLKAIDAALHNTIDKGQADAILNERLSNLEALRDIALKGVEGGEGNEQVGFLNTLAKLEEQITQLLQDAGVLRKATINLRHAGPDGKPLPVAQAQDITIRIGVPADRPKEKMVLLKSKAAPKTRE